MGLISNFFNSAFWQDPCNWLFGKANDVIKGVNPDSDLSNPRQVREGTGEAWENAQAFFAKMAAQFGETEFQGCKAWTFRDSDIKNWQGMPKFELPSTGRLDTLVWGKVLQRAQLVDDWYSASNAQNSRYALIPPEDVRLAMWQTAIWLQQNIPVYSSEDFKKYAYAYYQLVAADRPSWFDLL